MPDDRRTAQAFASSWNDLPAGSVYTREQFKEWFAPLTEKDVRGKTVLELGCGNGSLMLHMLDWQPARLHGVDLGDSVRSAQANLSGTGQANWSVEQGDLTRFQSPGFDLVYCIGVLHHLANPRAGFEAVVRNVTPGGHFHCWVYGHEGNAPVRWLLDPIRCLACHLPWRFTKYVLATGLVAPYYVYAKLVSRLPGALSARLPLGAYSRWIARREFAFFRHVAFDQLVTPRTIYLRRSEIEQWLRETPEVAPDGCYITQRNGNSWIFGGRRRA